MCVRVCILTQPPLRGHWSHTPILLGHFYLQGQKSRPRKFDVRLIRALVSHSDSPRRKKSVCTVCICVLVCTLKVGNHGPGNRDRNSLRLLPVCDCCSTGPFTMGKAVTGFACLPQHGRCFALWTNDSCWQSMGNIQSWTQYETCSLLVCKKMSFDVLNTRLTSYIPHPRLSRIISGVPKQFWLDATIAWGCKCYKIVKMYTAVLPVSVPYSQGPLWSNLGSS